MSMAGETYVSIDVEASGPIPGEYSMLSIGACVVGNTKKRFYVEMKPLNDNYVEGALKVCGLSMSKLKSNGVEPEAAIERFAKWVMSASTGRTPVFCCWSTMDWLFMKWYMVKFGYPRLFSHSACEMKSYYTGMMGVPFSRSRKKYLPEELMPKKKHTHNALDDALEQAELFENMFEFNRKRHATDR
jgi:DNA polymerase III epsilon subunit-like protein